MSLKSQIILLSIFAVINIQHSTCNSIHYIILMISLTAIYFNLDNHSVVLSGEPTALPKLVSMFH